MSAMPRYSTATFLDAINDGNRTINAIADAIGCSWATAHKRINSHNGLAEIYQKRWNGAGDQFGWLTVLRRAGADRHGAIMYVCKCKCGEIVTVRGRSLRRGETVSCGCFGRTGGTGKLRLSPRQGTPNRRKEPQYKVWRQAVLKRYDYTCVVCGTTRQNVRLCVHHLQSYKDYRHLRYVAKNGTVMCQSCHLALHSRYGRQCTEADFENFLVEAAR